MSRIVLVGVMVCMATVCLAQTSPNYSVTEHVFNEGGNPDNGVVLESDNFTISLDAVGQSMTAADLSSRSYNGEAGFVYAYPPPLEVNDLLFLSKTSMSWDPELSVGSYNVYRGLISSLGTGYGSCLEMDITDTNYEDTEHYGGQAYFYLITAANRLDEEGTLGYRSSGSERENTSSCN